MDDETPSGAPRISGRLRSALQFFAFVLLYVFFLLTFGLTTNAAIHLVTSALEEQTLVILVGVFGGLPAVCLATALMLMKFHDAPWSFVGLGFEEGWRRECARGFALGLALMALVVLIEVLTGHLRLRWNSAGLSAVALQVFLFLLIFLAGALHEEILFRGYPFQRLLEVLGAPLTVVLLSAAFGAIHYGNPNAGAVGIANTFVVGILFSVAYLRTGRLWFPIGLHWSWNFFEAAFGLPVSGITIEQMPFLAEPSGRELFHGGKYGPEASLVATVVFAAAIAGLLAWRRPGPAPAARDEAL